VVSLLNRLAIRDRVTDGYSVRFVLVTNGILDKSGQDYLQTVNSSDPKLLDVLDLSRLGPVGEMVTKPGLLAATHEFTVGKGKWFEETLSDGTRIVVASVGATDLVAMPGIDDRSLFDMNVRFGLGERTRVNRELAQTIGEPAEHPLFLAYHNGLTVLCHTIECKSSTVKITGMSVVNGCQSLLALHKQADDLTDSLRVLVRFVDFNGSASVAEQITYRTNNQNPINMRDLRANDDIQRAIKAEFARYFGKRIDYQIKRGAPAEQGKPLPNDSAAQLLMAFYNKEPWAAVRRLALFDERYKDIFNYHIHAQHIYLANLTLEEIESRKSLLNSLLASNFALLRIVVLYLVSELLDKSEEGVDFKENPLSLLPDREGEVREAVGRLAEFAIDSANDYVEQRLSEREEEADKNRAELVPYDYKTALKSRIELTRLGRDMDRHYRFFVRRYPEVQFRLRSKAARSRPTTTRARR
jgi:hypothetical protein